MNHNLTGLFAVGLLGAFCSCQQQSAAKIVGTVSPASAIETGVHWAAPTDFAQLKRLGHQFAVVSLDRDPDHWREVFDMADQAGIRLIAGLHPYPYKVNAAGEWEIELVGQQFIKYAQTRAPLVKALFVFNEPIWVDPATGRNTPCGALPAAQLRALRTRIHQIWPRALIYHDFGRPSLWAPELRLDSNKFRHPCLPPTSQL